MKHKKVRSLNQERGPMKIPKFEAQTEWVKPTEFPDLRQVDEIAIDLETKDPDLI